MALIGRPPKPPEERFWEKVDKFSQAPCWLWLDKLNDDGYGRIKTPYGFIGAHRYAWILANGCEVPEGKEICHTCDNTWCVNDEHLFAGTHLENEQDKTTKGRRPSGENHWTARAKKEGKVAGRKPGVVSASTRLKSASCSVCGVPAYPQYPLGIAVVRCQECYWKTVRLAAKTRERDESGRFLVGSTK